VDPQAVDLSLLRRILRTLLRDLLHKEEVDLGVCIVDAAEITRLNEAFLHHLGPTDVITFDYADRAPPSPGTGLRRAGTLRAAASQPLCGEIFVCLDVARAQARRFHTTWQSELVRYVVHGVLHLEGYDDRKAKDARPMKRAEDTLVAHLARLHEFRRLDRREPAGK
jgi:probable rRNA maturation factor